MRSSVASRSALSGLASTRQIKALGSALQAAEGGGPIAEVALDVAANKVRQSLEMLGLCVNGSPIGAWASAARACVAVEVPPDLSVEVT